VIWLHPAEIRFKIAPSRDLRGDIEGDWDIARRVPLAETVKYQSVVAHVRDGLPWIETALFQDVYSRRLAAGESIRGADTLEGLAIQYAAQVDCVFESMKAGGFTVSKGLPRLLKGRYGDIFIGNQGNHRLAMAHVLGLKSFAGEIVCRHP
jgi:hypothetical protein